MIRQTSLSLSRSHSADHFSSVLNYSDFSRPVTTATQLPHRALRQLSQRVYTSAVYVYGAQFFRQLHIPRNNLLSALPFFLTSPARSVRAKSREKPSAPGI